ncbi:hypothetical protein PROFUN_10813 [Planoprotostelium fungivorum]|uniref:F-box domain-containing protein n=1 Tax=Planoprotostelium fungivorum TaxID=1890364 RepID=A0A2P6NCP0_9EUKA|nr:hypothetical protein PROFUN_10813 [Planoprotostelium fungivorum]
MGISEVIERLRDRASLFVLVSLALIPVYLIIKRPNQLALPTRKRRNSFGTYSSLECMPQEILVTIFSHLSTDDLFAVSSVCRLLNSSVFGEQKMWKSHCAKSWPDSSSSDPHDWRLEYIRLAHSERKRLYFSPYQYMLAIHPDPSWKSSDWTQDFVQSLSDSPSCSLSNHRIVDANNATIGRYRFVSAADAAKKFSGEKWLNSDHPCPYLLDQVGWINFDLEGKLEEASDVMFSLCLEGKGTICRLSDGWCARSIDLYEYGIGDAFDASGLQDGDLLVNTDPSGPYMQSILTEANRVCQQAEFSIIRHTIHNPLRARSSLSREELNSYKIKMWTYNSDLVEQMKSPGSLGMKSMLLGVFAIAIIVGTTWIYYRYRRRHDQKPSPAVSVIDLPLDVLTHIFTFLDSNSVTAVDQTCQAFHKATQAVHLWKFLYCTHMASVYCLSYDPTSNILYSGGGDGLLSVWKLDRWLTPTVHPLPRPRPEEDFLFCGDAEGKIRKWDVNLLMGEHSQVSSEKREKVVGRHTAAVRGFSIDTEREHLFSAGEDGMIQVWDIRDDHLLCSHQISTPLTFVCCIDDHRVLFGTWHDMNIWEVDTDRVIKVREFQDSASTCRVTHAHPHTCHLTSKHTHLPSIIFVSFLHDIYQFDVSSGLTCLFARVEEAKIMNMSYDPCLKRLAVVTSNGRIYLFDSSNAEMISATLKYTNIVYSSVLFREKLILGSFDASIQIYRFL